MARVIKKEEVTVCNKCKCDVAYYKKEIQSEVTANYWGLPHKKEWIECPKCNYHILLKNW